MRYQIKLRGTTPLIQHNGAAGLDTTSAANREKAEIAKKRGSNRTEADNARLRELECQTSLWLDETGGPTIPPSAIRANIETSARKLKQGPQVREGLVVEKVTLFDYDVDKLGETVDELGKNAQFTVGVVVQRARILRTRAKFDDWAVVFIVECEDELVDKLQLDTWLQIGGKRIGLGDWRPEKSGSYGRFTVEEITELS